MKKFLVVVLILGAGTACAHKSKQPQLPGATPVVANTAQTTTPAPKKLASHALALDVVALQGNKSFTLGWDHDGVETEFYLIQVMDTATGAVTTTQVPVSVLVNGSAEFTFDKGLKRGSYSVVVVAANQDLQSEPSSPPLNLAVTMGKPSAPTGLRIIRK